MLLDWLVELMNERLALWPPTVGFHGNVRSYDYDTRIVYNGDRIIMIHPPKDTVFVEVIGQSLTLFPPVLQENVEIYAACMR